MAKVLGWRVTLVDSRRALANRDRFPEADSIIVTPPASMDEHVGFDGGSYAVVMTHRFAEDLDLLRILLARPIRYLGLLGSRGRAQRLLGLLRQEGATLDPAALEALRAPVGLDLGATNPEAIALSILAEMQCRQSGHAPVPLRDRAGSIHG
jgi:xanthine dehydrogenase accessory factor